MFHCLSQFDVCDQLKLLPSPNPEYKLLFHLSLSLLLSSSSFSETHYSGLIMGPILMSDKILSICGARQRRCDKNNHYCQQKNRLEWLWGRLWWRWTVNSVLLLSCLPGYQWILLLWCFQYSVLLDDFSLCSSVNVAKDSKTLLDRDPRKQPEVPADFFRWVLTKLWSSISKISAKKTSWNWSNEAFYLTAVYKYYISLRSFFWCKLLSILLFLPRMPPSSQLCSAASLHRRGVFIS